MPKIIAKKEDWVDLGYKLFSEKGISGIVIETMAEKLKVNKSSFYWHFKTKKEFIQQLIEFWINDETEQIIALTNAEKSALQKFKMLINLSYKQKPNQDFIFHLKRYAKKEKKTKSIIEKIDSERIEYVKGLLQEMGYSDQDAKIKSSLFYKHLIGYHEMIRYEKQSSDYAKEVRKELNQFIDY
ncbi:MAG: TetR/AcrR family transcriptional regulator [Phaeodactylibacter sp.]|uniref:TetR/AcrR family transcriptional regulator n=1 Tax=Phaeodactylibacter sp. TaxID=1940289 RepID=UPI0032EE1A06